MTSRHVDATRWSDDDRTRIVADRAPVPAQTYDPAAVRHPSPDVLRHHALSDAPERYSPAEGSARYSAAVAHPSPDAPRYSSPDAPGPYAVHGATIAAQAVAPPPPAAAQAEKPPAVRRTITVRLAAAIGVVAFLVGVGASMLVGALAGPGDPGAGGPGGGFGTPPGTSGQAVPGDGTGTST